MPCTECLHCHDLAARADLVLPPLPTAGGRAGIDRGFYRAFAAAYALARVRSQQPGKLMRTANPGLTPSQCRDYVQRSRQLGLLDDARTEPPPTPRREVPGGSTRGRRGGRPATVDDLDPRPEETVKVAGVPKLLSSLTEADWEAMSDAEVNAAGRAEERTERYASRR
jgi:hypothetical protein